MKKAEEPNYRNLSRVSKIRAIRNFGAAKNTPEEERAPTARDKLIREIDLWEMKNRQQNNLNRTNLLNKDLANQVTFLRSTNLKDYKYQPDPSLSIPQVSTDLINTIFMNKLPPDLNSSKKTRNFLVKSEARSQSSAKAVPKDVTPTGEVKNIYTRDFSLDRAPGLMGIIDMNKQLTREIMSRCISQGEAKTGQYHFSQTFRTLTNLKLSINTVSEMASLKREIKIKDKSPQYIFNFSKELNEMRKSAFNLDQMMTSIRKNIKEINQTIANKKNQLDALRRQDVYLFSRVSDLTRLLNHNRNKYHNEDDLFIGSGIKQHFNENFSQPLQPKNEECIKTQVGPLEDQNNKEAEQKLKSGGDQQEETKRSLGTEKREESWGVVGRLDSREKGGESKRANGESSIKNMREMTKIIYRRIFEKEKSNAINETIQDITQVKQQIETLKKSIEKLNGEILELRESKADSNKLLKELLLFILENEHEYLDSSLRPAIKGLFEINEEVPRHRLPKYLDRESVSFLFKICRMELDAERARDASRPETRMSPENSPARKLMKRNGVQPGFMSRSESQKNMVNCSNSGQLNSMNWRDLMERAKMKLHRETRNCSAGSVFASEFDSQKSRNMVKSRSRANRTREEAATSTNKSSLVEMSLKKREESGIGIRTRSIMSFTEGESENTKMLEVNGAIVRKNKEEMERLVNAFEMAKDEDTREKIEKSLMVEFGKVSAQKTLEPFKVHLAQLKTQKTAH